MDRHGVGVLELRDVVELEPVGERRALGRRDQHEPLVIVRRFPDPDRLVGVGRWRRRLGLRRGRHGHHQHRRREGRFRRRGVRNDDRRERRRGHATVRCGAARHLRGQRHQQRRHARQQRRHAGRPARIRPAPWRRLRTSGAISFSSAAATKTHRLPPPRRAIAIFLVFMGAVGREGTACPWWGRAVPLSTRRGVIAPKDDVGGVCLTGQRLCRSPRTFGAPR